MLHIDTFPLTTRSWSNYSARASSSGLSLNLRPITRHKPLLSVGYGKFERAGVGHRALGGGTRATARPFRRLTPTTPDFCPAPAGLSRLAVGALSGVR